MWNLRKDVIWLTSVGNGKERAMKRLIIALCLMLLYAGTYASLCAADCPVQYVHNDTVCTVTTLCSSWPYQCINWDDNMCDVTRMIPWGCGGTTYLGYWSNQPCDGTFLYANCYRDWLCHIGAKVSRYCKDYSSYQKWNDCGT